MRVKVSDTFQGQFGVYDPEFRCVARKTPEDGPFEAPDTDALRLIEKGVLVPMPREAAKKKSQKAQKPKEDPDE